MNLNIATHLMSEEELKQTLQQIKNGEKNWEDEYSLIIIKSMIQHIGSTDSVLRDELIYSSFHELIISKNLLEKELLVELLHDCLNDLLFTGIGESGTDTVFTRSFTSLLIALILFRDNEDRFLCEHSVYMAKEKLIDYMNAEVDLRGFVLQKGWAHSVAHVADVVDELVKNTKIGPEQYVELLKPLWNKIFVPHNIFVHDEDERILVPIIEMLNNGLVVQELETLLQNIPSHLKMHKQQLDEEHYRLLVFNCKTFLKSFHLKIHGNPHLHPLQDCIRKCLGEI
ncbi:DUF2785 domain-containing protein [Solibacillus sp. CAU 1738]|uniref:DUF2785 domain-containing protein n=1 Tax=Solibacillus sp. CAU 1738 TaxID=3140363 RepID=UPI00326137CD